MTNNYSYKKSRFHRMISAILTIALLCGTSAQKICPQSSPAQVISLPSVQPCKSSKLYSGKITTLTSNSELYLTNATLVMMRTCTSEATFYFFGVHTCVTTCLESNLSEDDANGIKNGFCPDNMGKHEKFENSHGSPPKCEYNWPRTTSTQAILCNRFKGHISYTHLGHPISSLGHVEDCDYYKGQCILSTGQWIFWEIDERSKASNTTTDENDALCDNSRIWFPKKNIGFGLITDGCVWTGFKSTMEGVMLKWQSAPTLGKSRSKRSIQSFDSDKELSVLEFIYGELTYQDDPFCETMLGVVSASTIMPYANPTRYAEMLLENSMVYAQIHGSYLFIWYCEYLIVNPRNDTTCHIHPRITYLLKNETQKGFIDNEGRIINESPVISCTSHMRVFSLNKHPYIELGQKTYELKVSTLSHLYTKPLGPINPNFTGIFPNHHDWSKELYDLQQTQSDLAEFSRSIGASLDGNGGGLRGTNLPGLKYGWFSGFVASIQTIGAIGGVLYLIKIILSSIAISNRTPAFARIGQALL